MFTREIEVTIVAAIMMASQAVCDEKMKREGEGMRRRDEVGVSKAKPQRAQQLCASLSRIRKG